jgi:hypothetical protein
MVEGGYESNPELDRAVATPDGIDDRLETFGRELGIVRITTYLHESTFQNVAMYSGSRSSVAHFPNLRGSLLLLHTTVNAKFDLATTRLHQPNANQSFKALVRHSSGLHSQPP